MWQRAACKLAAAISGDRRKAASKLCSACAQSPLAISALPRLKCAATGASAMPAAWR
jgi:hypothetical protein